MSEPVPAYSGRAAALATRHGKLELIGPALAPLGLKVVVAEVDTDAFGTFTGEVPRKGPPLEVAKRKARAAMAATGLDAGLASEGSFGPHPEIPFVTADVELVVLVDDRLGLTVHEGALGLETAAAGITVGAEAETELGEFCRRVGFPEQALICRPGDGGHSRIFKAIRDPATLWSAVRSAAGASKDHLAVVETDLRAHLCPTRRPVIAEAATRLAARLRRRCPACGAPGFGSVSHEPGLPCELCGRPTELARSRTESCPGCGHGESVAVEGRADPTYCAHCNP